MKRFVTAVAILFLTASPYVYAQAQSSKPVGASELSPGDIKNDTHGRPHRGASELSPGDLMRDRPTRMRGGASEFSPGDLKNDRRTTTRRGASEVAPGDRMTTLAVAGVRRVVAGDMMLAGDATLVEDVTVVAGTTVVAGMAEEGEPAFLSGPGASGSGNRSRCATLYIVG